jgi:peptidoglycan hydrolase-like protein with peptidoglycan-binding domain
MARPLNFAAAVVLGAVFGLFAAGFADLRAKEIAARPAGDLDLPSNNTAGEKQIDDDSSPFSRWRTAESIEKIQRALADMGLYLGPIDGHLNEETRAAIRIYQQGAGMKVDGKVTRELWDLLNNAQRVRALLLRLEKARKSSRDAARKALLAHPATRDLVDQPNNERADPTRSADACFNTPTVRCLLAEASESVKAVFRPELRDWALGEILVAEARAGLTEGAMQTVRRIRDPRLIMVALRDIAEAEAASGRPAEALAAADIIPDRDKQADAFAAIASIQIQRKEIRNARVTIKRLLAVIDGLEPTLRRVQLLSRAAVVIAESGDGAGASEQVSTAKGEARGKLAGLDQSAALHHVASALADMARPEEAIALLPEITTASERTSILVTAAEAQMRGGDAAAALATADTIDSIRFKAAVLGRIAQAQASAGERAHAVTTIDLALAAIDKIESAFARSFAISRVALAMASITDADPATAATYAKATETAKRIEDNRLRAQTLWSIAEMQRTAGDVTGSEATESEAKAATQTIVSRLSQVWMFSDIALGHARTGKRAVAETALDRGLEVARGLDNAWGRARALARLATVLVEIADPHPYLPIEPAQ